MGHPQTATSSPLLLATAHFSAVALSSWARASLRYRIARALLMASQIPRNRRRIQVQEKDLVPGSAGEAAPGGPIRLNRSRAHDSPHNPDAPAAFLDSCRAAPRQ